MKTQRGASPLEVLGSILIVAGVLVVAAVGLWKFGWFVEEKNTDQRVRIINHNSGTQTAWMDEVQKTITDFEATDPANVAYRNALAQKACALIPRLTEPYKNTFIEAFEQEHCGP